MSTKNEGQVPLGATVRYSRVVERAEIGRRGHTWRIEALDAPKEGVFVGYRYKQNGYWATDSDWEMPSSASSYWQETGSRVKVALVVDHPWQEPWTVDPSSLEVQP